MDVTFISSGAMSRAQYALVRKVENAASPQAADKILLNELDVIRRNLQQPHLSIVRRAFRTYFNCSSSSQAFVEGMQRMLDSNSALYYDSLHRWSWRPGIRLSARRKSCGAWQVSVGQENWCVSVFAYNYLSQLHTGYTFCMELMPPNHELQLMLVNTLRKVSVLVVQ
jgi:AP-4 complex subunit epsilon-1